MPMPNPTPQQSGGVSSNSTPQSSTVIQNNVSDTNSVLKQNNVQQKLAEVLTNISARLDNVTNLRTQTQSAVYDSFGNNFITRGATQLTDSVFDSISSLFEKKQAPVEDNVLKELKKHTEVLSKLVTSTTDGAIDNDTFTELIDLNSRALQVHELILSRLDKIGVENHEYYNESITFLEDQKKLSEKNLEMLHNALTHITKHGDTSSASDGKIKFKEAKKQSQHTIDKNIVVIDPNIIDVDLPLETAQEEILKSPTIQSKDDSVTDVSEKSSNDKKELSLLKSISNTLLDMSKSIKTFFHDQPLSKQETELESERKNKTSKSVASDKILNKEELKDSSFFGKIISSIIGGLTMLVGFFSGTGMKSFLQIFGKAIFTIIGGLTALMKFFGGDIIKTISDALGKIKDILPGRAPTNVPSPEGPSKVPSKTPPVPESPTKTPSPSNPKTPPIPDDKTKSIGSKIAEYGKKGIAFAKNWALPSAIMTGIGMMGGTMIDEVAKDAGMGYKTVDAAKDQSNWERMGLLEKIESGAARSIEKVGTLLNLDNVINDARAERIEKETDYLDDKLRSIEEKQREIDKEMKSRMIGGSNQVVPVQTTPTVIDNSTVMPIRESVKNTDDSFNRYLASVLG